MLESVVYGFLVYRALYYCACSVDPACNSRQHRNNVLPFALASGVVYTFLDLASSVLLSEFELTMIVGSAWKYKVECARLHTIGQVHIYRCYSNNSCLQTFAVLRKGAFLIRGF